tara:strand:+ start:46 stop:666 length:621 start_codon:yes stop_codon:yes gene_type:complete
MIDKNNIINAVSPLKKRTKSYKGGTKTKKAATGTAKRAAGFDKSTSATNKAGYNVNTKFKAVRGQSAGGKPTASVPSPTKPYSYGKDGKLSSVTNNYINNDDHSTINTVNAPSDAWEETTKVKELESYDDFWETRIKSGKYSKGMQKYINKHGGDLDAAKKEWEIVSKANEGKRNKNRKTTTTRTRKNGNSSNIILSGSKSDNKIT